jgi:hypothetical protein
VLAQAGFCDVAVREKFDTFRGTSKERIARKYGVTGINVFARKTLAAASGRKGT